MVFTPILHVVVVMKCLEIEESVIRFTYAVICLFGLQRWIRTIFRRVKYANEHLASGRLSESSLHTLCQVHNLYPKSILSSSACFSPPTQILLLYYYIRLVHRRAGALLTFISCILI